MSNATDSRPTVLFVDDSRLMRFTARKSLEGRYTVILAEGGDAAIEALDANPDVAAVVTDLMMPDTDGFDLIRHVRGSTDDRIRRLPIMAVTGSTVEGDRLRALELGADDLMTKPFRPAVLQERVARMMAAEAEAETETETEQAPAQTRVEVPSAANVERSRAGLVERLGQALALHVRHDMPLTVLHVRLTNAARIEAEKGAAMLNAVMRHLEHELAHTVRVEDTIGRTGRDHYTVLLPATALDDARHLRRRLREKLGAQAIQIDGRAVQPELSMLLHVPKRELDARDLLRPYPGSAPDNVTPLRRAGG